MEICLAREGLADELGADDDAVLDDQAAFRLMGKEGSRDARHAERIGKTEKQREEQDEDDGRTDFFQHGFFPQTRPSAVMTTSMSLMPTNGTMMPPAP